MNATEQIAALESRVAELAETVKLISSAPQLRAFVVEQQRIARIKSDADLVALLVNGSPEERAGKIAGLNAYRLRQVAELLQFSDIVEICRGLDRAALGALMTATNAEVRRRAIAESMPADQLPDLVRLRATGGGKVEWKTYDERNFTKRAFAVQGDEYLVLARGEFEALVSECAAAGADHDDLGKALATGRLGVEALAEQQVRDHLAQNGRLDESAWTVSLIDPRDEAAADFAARQDMPITAASARRKRAEKAATSEPATESPAAETRRYQREQAAREREARVGELAEAVTRALDRKASKKKAPK